MRYTIVAFDAANNKVIDLQFSDFADASRLWAIICCNHPATNVVSGTIRDTQGEWSDSF